MNFEFQKITREIEIEGFNSIYYFEFGKDFSHPPEKHNFWEMVYVDSGEINAITDGIGVNLLQGQVIFHSPNEIHAHVSNQKVPNNMLVVSFSTKSPSMQFFDRKIFTLDKTEKTLLSLFLKEAQNALGAIPCEYDDKRPPDFSNAPFGSPQLLECYLTEFLLLLKRAGENLSVTKSRSDAEREIAQSSIVELISVYLKNNIYSEITLSDICSAFYMGKTQICKLFSEYMQISPMEYFSKLKMAEAKKMLLSADVSVSRLSDMLGYSSIHNFSRAFKKSVGCSPTEYRKRINH